MVRQLPISLAPYLYSRTLQCERLSWIIMSINPVEGKINSKKENWGPWSSKWYHQCPWILLPMLDSCKPSPAGYLYNLFLSKHRRVFSRTCFSALLSALLVGRFHGIPCLQRLCPCGSREAEMLIHTVSFSWCPKMCSDHKFSIYYLC